MIVPSDGSALASVRADIAREMLGPRAPIPRQLGTVTLRPHQHAAAVRLVSLIAAHGGAMLAEPVGVGKTYTALAVAAALGRNERILIAAPASLRSMWSESAAKCGIVAGVVSHEALSRGSPPAASAGIVIVDESHRLRSPSTRRYALLAELCRTSRVLLVTATPVQNRRADLATQLALFLGRPAWRMSDEDLAAYVVRDSSSDAGARPRLSGPHSVALATTDDCLDQILALPPPVPAKDEGVAAALVSYGLIHQWTSSRAALERALQRRRARGLALASAIEAGCRPTRAELSAWTHADDALQLAFPELVAEETWASDADVGPLRRALEGHALAIEAVLRRLRITPDPDVERANALRRIRDRHAGERIIAFCHYAETVNALRSRMSRDSGVAALTAHGARVAGGRISRDDVLRQFEPRMRQTGDGCQTGNACARNDNGVWSTSNDNITLLITTDLLSEGLNLQEASVIVHLDLPWNPARLEQRVGRARRLGSRHAVVTVYTIAPPAAAERLLHIERRLRDKLRVAQHTIGIAGHVLPPLAQPSDQQGIAEQASAIELALRRWLTESACPTPSQSTRSGQTIASMDSDVDGFLALVRDDRGLRLVADVGSGIDTRIAATLRAVAACDAPDGPETSVDPHRAAAATEQLSTWLAARRGESAIDLRAATAAHSRRAALARVAQALSRAPRHQRSLLAPLADAARAVATAPLAEGAERILDTLVGADLPDEAWLRSIAAFGALNARNRPSLQSSSGLVAMILLGRSRTPL